MWSLSRADKGISSAVIIVQSSHTYVMNACVCISSFPCGRNLINMKHFYTEAELFYFWPILLLSSPPHHLWKIWVTPFTLALLCANGTLLNVSILSWLSEPQPAPSSSHPRLTLLISLSVSWDDLNPPKFVLNDDCQICFFPCKYWRCFLYLELRSRCSFLSSCTI